MLSRIIVLWSLGSIAADRPADVQHSDRYREKLAAAACRRLYRDGNVYTAAQTNGPLTEATALNPFWESLRNAPQEQKDANLRRALRLGFCTTCTPSTYLRKQRWHLAAAAIVGANLELRDLENCTPLYCAVTSRDVELARILLSHGAIITPAMIRCSGIPGSGHSPAVLHELITYGSARPGHSLGAMIDQSRALFDAVSHYDNQQTAANTIHQLLNAGASITVRDRSDANLLQSACHQVCASAITFWRSYGFDPFQRTAEGDTCLHLICSNRRHHDETIVAAYNALRATLTENQFAELAALQNHSGRRALELAFPSVRRMLNNRG